MAAAVARGGQRCAEPPAVRPTPIEMRTMSTIEPSRGCSIPCTPRVARPSTSRCVWRRGTRAQKVRGGADAGIGAARCVRRGACGVVRAAWCVCGA
eukprot:610472-Prymnesium_polylepis.1